MDGNGHSQGTVIIYICGATCIPLIGLTAPAALKGSLSQVKSRREDEHLAQLDLIQLDLIENSFFIGKRS